MIKQLPIVKYDRFFFTEKFENYSISCLFGKKETLSKLVHKSGFFFNFFQGSCRIKAEKSFFIFFCQYPVYFSTYSLEILFVKALKTHLEVLPRSYHALIFLVSRNSWE